jgi:hypothetical protein
VEGNGAIMPKILEWFDADFEGFINDLQASFENDEIKDLLEGAKSYLESEGIEIKE